MTPKNTHTPKENVMNKPTLYPNFLGWCAACANTVEILATTGEAGVHPPRTCEQGHTGLDVKGFFVIPEGEDDGRHRVICDLE